jgi:hypothetical protein
MSVARNSVRPHGRVAMRWVTETAVGSVGVTLIVCACAADQKWFDRHFMPVFFLSHDAQATWESLARQATAALGAALALVLRPRIGRFIGGARYRSRHRGSLARGDTDERCSITRYD